MKLVAVLSDEAKLGSALNALAQMSLGLGHRLSGAPDTDIFFGNSKQVRAFRTLAAEIATANSESSVYGDFPHTMEVGNMAALVALVTSTPEEIRGIKLNGPSFKLCYNLK